MCQEDIVIGLFEKADPVMDVMNFNIHIFGTGDIKTVFLGQLVDQFLFEQVDFIQLENVVTPYGVMVLFFRELERECAVDIVQ